MALFNSKVHVWVEFTARNLLWMKAFPNHCSLKRLTKDTTGTFTNYSYWISTLLYFRCLIRTHGLFLTTILERATILPWCHCEDQLSEHTQGFKPLARSCMWAIHSSAALRLVAPLCLTLCDPTLCSLPGSSVPGDSPGKNGLPCPPPTDLPNPGAEPWSPTLRADSLLPGTPKNIGVG